MLRYILRRILIFIPTLIIITLLGFVISVNAPGDPSERMVKPQAGEAGTQTGNTEQQKKFWREKLGLDLPVFYFSLTSLARPDTLYKVYNKNEREALDRLISKYGNWPAIQDYYVSLKNFHDAALVFAPDTNAIAGQDKNAVLEAVNQLKYESLALKATWDEQVIASKFNTIGALLEKYPFLSRFRKAFVSIREQYGYIGQHTASWKNYIPRIAFYGTGNQYHRWLFGDGGKTSKGVLLHGDFGISYVTRQPIADVIWSKIGWSLFFTVLSVVLAYFVSIPIGVKAAAKKGSRDREGGRE